MWFKVVYTSTPLSSHAADLIRIVSWIKALWPSDLLAMVMAVGQYLRLSIALRSRSSYCHPRPGNPRALTCCLCDTRIPERALHIHLPAAWVSPPRHPPGCPAVLQAFTLRSPSNAKEDKSHPMTRSQYPHRQAPTPTKHSPQARSLKTLRK